MSHITHPIHIRIQHDFHSKSSTRILSFLKSSYLNFYLIFFELGDIYTPHGYFDEFFIQRCLELDLKGIVILSGVFK